MHLPKKITLELAPEIGFQDNVLLAHIAKQYRCEPEHIRLIKRSIDARGKRVLVRVEAELYPEKAPPLLRYDIKYASVADKKSVLVIGAGPAGLFAALRLIELGFKPVIIERGKDVRARRRDLAAIQKEHIVNPESNYCFGEGGAGTYSDGKLYTRSSKRGDIRRILEILVMHGGTENILVDAHPHIGTNKLPQLVQRLRETILNHGGEIHFETRMDDILVENGSVRGILSHLGDIFEASAIILATGHSARDVYELLYNKNILIEAKPFAMGVRVEHPQALIDSIQYHSSAKREEWLPAASYSLVAQAAYKGVERGVFSFCMCPGGFIVPSATSPGELVVNGMSPSRRDSEFANSGIVVAINVEDMDAYKSYGPLAGLQMQSELERKIWSAGGKTQSAPAQRLIDFCQNKISPSLNRSSYIPGLSAAPMHEILPDFIRMRLQEGFKTFGKKLKGYYTNEAQIIGLESRTSSPVRIPRDKLTLMHPEVSGLFPCAEGAGYAGGIVSAAMDGEQCAEQVWKMFERG